MWEQHPEADRWKRSKFRHFFQDGLTNDLGCFVIKEKRSGRPAGSTRFYGFDEADREIKEAMLTRAFKVVGRVFFDIGPQNFRSIAAVKEWGAVFSHDESDSKAVYMLSKQQWFKTFRVC